MKRNLNLKEKILLSLVCIVLLIPYIPTQVFAAAGDTIYVGGVELSKSTPYLASEGTSATGKRPTGGYAKWDADNNTLTLNNFQYNGQGKNLSGHLVNRVIYSIIYSEGKNIKIVIEGNNKISITDEVDSPFLIYYKNGELTIGGNGKLELALNETHEDGYLIYGTSNLIINSGTIIGNVQVETVKEGTGCILLPNNNITINGGNHTFTINADKDNDDNFVGINSGKFYMNKGNVNVKVFGKISRAFVTKFQYEGGTIEAKGGTGSQGGDRPAVAYTYDEAANKIINNITINNDNYYWKTSESDKYTHSYNNQNEFSGTPNYFKFTETPTSISYDANGGVGTMDTEYYDTNNNFTLPQNTFTRENYEFDRWNTKKDGTGSSYSAGGNIQLTQNLILYAQWKPNFAVAPTVKECDDIKLIYKGENKNISVNVSSDQYHTLSYQWYKCDDEHGNNSQLIDDATNSFYTINSNENVVNTYYYYCEVTATLKHDSTKTETTKSGIVVVTINPADISYEIKDGYTGVYTGKSYKYNIVAPNGATVKYGTKAGEYTLDELPEFSDAGKYTFYYKIELDNHNTVEKKIETEITKAPLTIAAKDNSITYGDKPSNKGVTYKGFLNNDNESVLSGDIKYTYNYNQYDDVGNYNIDISSSNLTAKNYEIIYEKGNLNVEQKEIGIDWEKTTLTINGQEQAPTAKATNTVNNDNITLSVGGKQIKVGEYTATVTTINGEKAKNYKLPIDTSTEFIIQKDTPDIGIVGYTGQVLDTTLPKDVILTRTDSSVDGVLELTDSILLSNQTIYNWVFTPTDTSFYNIIAGTVEIDVIDTVKPNILIETKDNIWKEFINNITFGAFYDESQTVSITATDNENGSGIEEILYYISDTELTLDELKNVEWERYVETFNINPANQYVIYAKTIDNDRNVSDIVNSDGLILYGDSTVITKNIKYIYHQNTDKTVSLNLNRNTIKNIKNDKNTLIKNKDYTVSADETITLKSNYLNTLEVGDYKLTITYNPMGKETDQVNITNEIILSVSKANATYTSPTINELKYNGKEQELITAGTANGGTMMYSLNESENYSKEIPTATDAGEYKVYYYVEGDSNYNSSKVDYVIVTVAKANAIYTAPTSNELIYNGKQQELITAGTAEGGTMIYSLSENGKYSKDIPTATKAGEYKVYYYVDGDSNHNSSDIKCITAKIEENIKEDLIDSPETGDNIMVYIGLLLISVIGISIVTKIRKNIK